MKGLFRIASLTLWNTLISILCLSSALAWDAPLGGTTQPQPSSGNIIPPYVSGARKDIKPDSPEALSEAFLDSNYQKCGQDCLYNKANENITIQMDYILKKYQFLNTPESVNPEATETNKRELLAGFCGTSEGINHCIDRFNQLNKFWLLKARGSLGKHESYIADLSCTRFNSDGTCASTPEKPPEVAFEGDLAERQQKLRPQIPYYPKSKELGALAKRQAAQQGQQGRLSKVRDTYQWATDLVTSLEPNQDDFIKFRRIPRDPSNPAMGYFEVPVTKNGKPEYDQIAYDRAHQEWQGHSGESKQVAHIDPKKEKPGKDKDPAKKAKKSNQEDLKKSGLFKYLKETVVNNSVPLQIQDNAKRFEKEFSDQVKGDDRSISRKLYDNARGENITGLTEFIKKSPKWGQTNQAEFPGSNKTSDARDPSKPKNDQKYKPSGTQRPSSSVAQSKMKQTASDSEANQTYTGEEDFKFPTQGSDGNSRYSITWHASQIVPKFNSPSASNSPAPPSRPNPPDEKRMPITSGQERSPSSGNGLDRVTDSEPTSTLDLNFE